MIALAVLAQAVMQVPVADGPALPPVTTRYSIVVARAVRQSDPKPIDCGAASCTSWYLGNFDQSHHVAGEPLPASFDARIEMGSPFNQQYVLAMLVETLADGTRRIRAKRGFHYQTRLACFDAPDTAQLDPPPVGDRLVRQGKQICVTEK